MAEAVGKDWGCACMKFLSTWLRSLECFDNSSGAGNPDLLLPDIVRRGAQLNDVVLDNMPMPYNRALTLLRRLLGSTVLPVPLQNTQVRKAVFTAAKTPCLGLRNNLALQTSTHRRWDITGHPLQSFRSSSTAAMTHFVPSSVNKSCCRLFAPDSAHYRLRLVEAKFLFPQSHSSTSKPFEECENVLQIGQFPDPEGLPRCGATKDWLGPSCNGTVPPLSPITNPAQAPSSPAPPAVRQLRQKPPHQNNQQVWLSLPCFC